MSIYLANMDVSRHLRILRSLRDLLNTRHLHTSPWSVVLMPLTDMLRWVDNLIISWHIVNLYLYKYEMFVCLFVCLFVHVFLGHFETDWDTLWHKVAFRPRMSSKTIKFQKKLFFAELLPFFYISLRFLCKFEERL